MSKLFVKHLSKSWGDTEVLHDISFNCKQGSLLVLLGPSGCGKSTTLRLIAGLEDPSQGSIMMDEKEITHLVPGKRGIAMVFQNYALFPHLSVVENILFGLKARKIKKDEQQKRLKYAASVLGLSDLLDRRPSQLSGGQRQRVALGRAIVYQSSICLMDEPLSNLDAKLRQEMRQEIRSLQQRLGITMIYVTHDQTEAMTMADQIILMKDGEIEQIGTPEELYKTPATAYSGNFIGTPPMNILRPDQKILSAFESRKMDQELLSKIEKQCLIGVRPEHIQLDETGIPATINTIEYLGSETLIACQIENQPILFTTPNKLNMAPGGAIKIGWGVKNLHVFDAKSGKRDDSVYHQLLN
ncbi:MAG: ABC transporter ATP-binding protein [Deltaproteobacteria bacterium]|jgi:sn-glycerol 3-phosphate transport system ATP-binding protein|nr:ABC transporter ATP-binding protein [Deltaproteobacteria bacterium]